MKILTIYDYNWEGIQKEFHKFINDVKDKYDLILWVKSEEQMIEVVYSKLAINLPHYIPRPDEDVFDIVNRYMNKNS